MRDFVKGFAEIHYDHISLCSRGCWTGPGRGKEAECHMINFSESRVEVHREFCSNLGVA